MKGENKPKRKEEDRTPNLWLLWVRDGGRVRSLTSSFAGLI